MKIREATEKDFKAVQILSVQLGHEYPVTELKKNLCSILKTEDQKILLAENEETDEVIGYIHVQKYVSLYSESLLNIIAMVVDNAWRNKGVGSSLIKKAEETALNYKCIGFRVTSSEKRIDAHKFYLRKGFDIVKNQKRFIRYFN